MNHEHSDQEEPMEATPDRGPALPPPAQSSGGGATTGKVLRRSLGDRKIAGVAGGIAEHFGLDPLLVRVIFVLLALSGAVGIALYIAGWLLIPEEGSSRSVGDDLVDRLRNSPTWAPVLLIVVGSVIALGNIPSWGGGLVWAAAFIGAGIWLYRRSDAPPPPPADPAAGAPGAGVRGAADVVTAEVQAAADAATRELRIQQQRIRRARPPRSHLGRLTVAAALVAVGVVAMLGNTGAITVSSRHYPAIAMLVIGAGLLGGTFWGRSRGLVFLGLLIAPFALAASLIRVPWDGGAGERFFSPATAAEAAKGYRLIAGSMNLDLTRMDWSEPVRIDASVAFGEIVVSVPADVRVEVDGHVGAGTIMLFGEERSGTDVDFDTVEGSELADRTLELDVQASFGQVVVARSGSPAGDFFGGTDGITDGGRP
jgi:phage shock protein PspC (stress-responsive transcriptional regulator)